MDRESRNPQLLINIRKILILYAAYSQCKHPSCGYSTYDRIWSRYAPNIVQ